MASYDQPSACGGESGLPICDGDRRGEAIGMVGRIWHGRRSFGRKRRIIYRFLDFRKKNMKINGRKSFFAGKIIDLSIRREVRRRSRAHRGQRQAVSL